MEDLILFLFKSMLALIAFVIKAIIYIINAIFYIASYLYNTTFIQYVIGTETYKTFSYIFLLLSVLAVIAAILMIITLAFSKSSGSQGDDYDDDEEDEDEDEEYFQRNTRRMTSGVKQYGSSGLFDSQLPARGRPYITFEDSGARVVSAKRGLGNSWYITVESNGLRMSKTVSASGSRGSIYFGKSQGNIEWGD